MLIKMAVRLLSRVMVSRHLPAAKVWWLQVAVELKLDLQTRLRQPPAEARTGAPPPKDDCSLDVLLLLIAVGWGEEVCML